VSKRAKFLLGIGVIAALVVGFQVAAFAIHTEKFELDGNATDSPAGGLEDWANICKSLTNDPLCATAAPSSAVEKAFVSEPANVAATKSTSVFTGGGSKDESDVPNWLYKSDGGLPDKDNLTHSYAALYPDGTDKLLYFGADRYDNSGDAALGFWFFKNPVAQSPNPAPDDQAGSFTGNHTTGDLLIISNFSNGGQVSNIKAYTWDPKCGTDLPLVKESNIKLDDGNADNDCAANNLRLELNASNATCPPVGQDDACAIVNQGTITMPFKYDDKTTNGQGAGANTALKSEFFEGGLDLGAIGLADACFTTVLAETRASTSTDATLKDFTIGPFGSCGSEVTTQESVGAGSTQIEADGTNSVTDNATVNVTGAQTWQGKVQFYLCGADTATTPTITTCAQTVANEIGGPVNISNATTNHTVTSAAASVTSAGKYCWSAKFTSETTGVPNGTDTGLADECFTITPRTPTLATTAGPDVNLGSTVSDTATLSGTVPKPGTTSGVTDAINPATAGAAAGGTITFKLYGPSDTSCGNLVYTSPTVAVSGNNDYSTPNPQFQPTAPGNYHWVAEYSGDSPNTNATSHNAPDPNATPPGGCTDANEDVTVTSVPSLMTTAQKWLPNDSATISATQGGNLDGSVTFQAFDAPNCSGNSIYGPETVDVAGPSSGVTVSTTNTTALTSSKDVYWRVSYDSDNSAQQDIGNKCTESSSLTITNGSQQQSP
jgi:hypothetical protein